MAAEINLHLASRQVTISACLFLYGTEASTHIGDLIVKEINTLFNEPQATFTHQNQIFPVVFDVRYEIVATADVLDLARVNQDYRNNYIRIEKANRITRSFMGFGLGDNTGHWLTTDNLGESTTAAHEFGHSLGLAHPDNPDFRGSATPPPIMAARGSLVNPQYQWNPQAKAGEFGGTMNPKYRRVTLQEIELILEGLTFETTDTYYVGNLSNHLYDHQGTVV